MNDNALKDDLDMVFDKLQNFLKTETVVGEPIKIGDTTLVPFITVSFGCGGGGGEGKDEKNLEGAGSGIGACARITPNAVLVIKGDDISMLPVKNKSNLENLIKMVPDIVKKFKPGDKEKGEDQKKEDNK